MNNKTLLFVVIGVLLLGGVFVLSKNQSSVSRTTQGQPTVGVANDEKVEKEDGEKKEEMVEKEDKDEETTVSVTDAGFEPQTVTVKAGAKVVWTNNTKATTNVSSANHPTHLVYPPLNLGNFEPGDSVSLVFADPGTYKYHDHLDPSKFGTVVVE